MKGILTSPLLLGDVRWIRRGLRAGRRECGKRGTRRSICRTAARRPTDPEAPAPRAWRHLAATGQSRSVRPLKKAAPAAVRAHCRCRPRRYSIAGLSVLRQPRQSLLRCQQRSPLTRINNRFFFEVFHTYQAPDTESDESVTSLISR